MLTWLGQDHIFFWDTVQFAGRHGQWFYHNNFASCLLPESLDSGHPPVFGWYLALVWQLFGKSLAVSHWAMFPFLVGIVWQLVRLSHCWLRHISAYWLLFILLLDPVLLGQSVLVSPDLVLTFFFLLALNSIWYGQRGWLAVAALGLAAVSMRGMMVVAELVLYQCIVGWPSLRRFRWWDWWLIARPYLPAALFSALFLWIHYRQTGWIAYHPDSPWAPSFDRLGPAGVLRNLAILGWRWLDYGRLLLWLPAFYLLYRQRKTIGKLLGRPVAGEAERKMPQPVVLLCCLGIMLSISFLMYRGLQAHRYLLPVFLTFSFCVIIGLDRLPNVRLRRFFLGLMLLAMLTGNAWIYPQRIAQGWDATLAHWPYYSLREQMLDYLDAADIALEAVGTAFPEIGPLSDRDLSGRNSGFREKDLQADRYILYSNVMNDFSDEEIDGLQRDWEAVAHFQKLGVFITLYARPDRKL
ncbi:hypothetical protein [Flavilitoribacter nigricans]|uniref:Glycosyltransferase RgtA/B/C/D-like domain-containing protein n=1 Tax=Flavilitoribacter nigricans (strain ATCC 23147 / DSM 23189 / NBRC 102662 / NCIMB 1420 / SS-2) TaxID=1122177 RepID=A0A2D0NDD7_FLAN2|nr:hypothetical protein [Flavilitoribacter nigricans]PHN06512.1 hypothetical protein CRP01_09400 [Flavilitoribacter nigricans DSM 23189 = NBRC 102662]